jgi:hypothetical protein
MSHHRTSTLATMATIPLLLVGLLGCGSTDDGPDAKVDPSPDGKQSSVSFDDWQLSFSDCMRGKGIDLPDPNPDGGIALDNGGDPDAFAAAAEACRDELGDPPAPEGGRDTKPDAQVLADQLKIATCLRDQGYDVSDPDSGGGLNIPDDVPPEVLETCAPEGILSPAKP